MASPPVTASGIKDRDIARQIDNIRQRLDAIDSRGGSASQAQLDSLQKQIAALAQSLNTRPRDTPTTTTGIDGAMQTLTSAESTTMTLGTPVYVSGEGACMRAVANSRARGTVVGLVAISELLPGIAGAIRNSGVLRGATAQWDAITGDTGGLVPDAFYFLSLTAGRLSRSPLPSSSRGSVNTVVGLATSSTDMKLLLRDPLTL